MTLLLAAALAAGCGRTPDRPTGPESLPAVEAALVYFNAPYADRHLHARVHRELDDTQQGQHAGADAEALLRVEAGDAERGAVEHRDGVRDDAESPHHPRAPRNHPHDPAQQALLPSASETCTTYGRAA